jgi:glycosyltransferase involved in cell wall biosynthesis
MDILVAPGYCEPWGIRVNESLQRGQPVICSDGLGASDLIVESGCGMVFQRDNYKQLADCMEIYIQDRNKIVQDSDKGLLYRDKISCHTKAKELFNKLSCI